MTKKCEGSGLLQDRLTAGKVCAHTFDSEHSALILFLEIFMPKASRSMNIHLGAELKSRWVACCEQLGKTPGAALKEAIEHQLANASTNPTPKTYRQFEEAKELKQRFEILMTDSEKAAVRERSEATRCSMRRWIIDAIRAGLTHEPQFGMAEIEALGESNYQLLAIGRNLNQVARRLNDGHYEPITVERIQALHRIIDRHVETVAVAIGASLHRWRITE